MDAHRARGARNANVESLSSLKGCDTDQSDLPSVIIVLRNNSPSVNSTPVLTQRFSSIRTRQAGLVVRW